MTIEGWLLLIIIAGSVIIIVLAGHAILFGRCAVWYLDGIPLIRSDRAEYDRRKANPPWFIRYRIWLMAVTRLLDRRTLG